MQPSRLEMCMDHEDNILEDDTGDHGINGCIAPV